MDFTKTALGIEFGSTRIKAVLIDANHMPVYSGSHEWENKLENGIWTYSLDDIHNGLHACYRDLKNAVKEKFGETLTTVGAIGISGMMHGYFAFDKDGKLLAPFRTWRNTITGPAAEKLSKVLKYNMPQRWGAAHVYQAILNGEDHVNNIAHLTTLSSYITYRLTGEWSFGVGEASGMFPIDSDTMDFDRERLAIFDSLHSCPWKLGNILPKVLVAGEKAGTLTEEGAKFLDPDGDIKAGIPLCPPEGDAGTGMVATNSCRVRTGNVSAGTSSFAMLVTDKKVGVHKEIDMITTPSGLPVAMAHCNNCTSDINAWVGLFHELAENLGVGVSKGKMFEILFNKALEADPDCGGLLSFNYFSGEAVTDLEEGRPVFARMPDAKFSLANFMRSNIMSAIVVLKIGLDILAKEGVTVDKLYGHGGYFKTPGVGQRILSAAVNAPVSVMETAGEGGPYGMALLAAYMIWKEDGETLEDFLDNKVFSNAKETTLMATPEEVKGFADFTEKYMKALAIERSAVETMR